MRSIILARFFYILAAFTLTLTAQADEGRKLPSRSESMVAVELATVGVDPVTHQPVAILVEPQSGDVVPVVIGATEARAIILALHGVPVPRPMTHDLISNIFAASGLHLQRLLIDGLEEGTYFGALELRADDRAEPILVDTRPSDGLAIAVREQATIMMTTAVLQAARSLGYGNASEQTVSAAGITVIGVSDGTRAKLALGDEPGVLVSRTEGEANDVGLLAGSFIVEVNGGAPHSPLEFLELIQRTPAHRKAHIAFRLDGRRHEVDLTIDSPDLKDELQTNQPRLEV